MGQESRTRAHFTGLVKLARLKVHRRITTISTSLFPLSRRPVINNPYNFLVDLLQKTPIRIVVRAPICLRCFHNWRHFYFLFVENILLNLCNFIVVFLEFRVQAGLFKSVREREVVRPRNRVTLYIFLFLVVIKVAAIIIIALVPVVRLLLLGFLLLLVFFPAGRSVWAGVEGASGARAPRSAGVASRRPAADLR